MVSLGTLSAQGSYHLLDNTGEVPLHPRSTESGLVVGYATASEGKPPGTGLTEVQALELSTDLKREK